MAADRTRAGPVDVFAWRRSPVDRLGAEIVFAFVVGAGAFALAALLSAASRTHVPGPLLGLLFIVAVLSVARIGGVVYAVPVGLASMVAFDWYFLPPTHALAAPGAADTFALGSFILTAVLVGEVAAGAGRRADASEEARGVLADEQAALRRVATLVAGGVQQTEVFTAVVEEIAKLFAIPIVGLVRYEPDRTATTVARSDGGSYIGRNRDFPFEGSVLTSVLRTGRPARLDDFSELGDERAETAADLGIDSAFGAPIIVDGRVWGCVMAGVQRDRSLPANVVDRLTGFTELVATAISNAETRAKLNASRARVVAAGDDARRQLERDLHDGIQQRLVSLSLKARTAETMAPPLDDLRGQLSEITAGLTETLDELRELSRGIHPAILSKGGLGAALKALARRSAVRVELDVRSDRRLPERVEVASYYVVSEALANAAKHARASVVYIDVETVDSVVQLEIRDDGIGGANPVQGSGLIGLSDRVEALGGSIAIDSLVGCGTSLLVKMPIEGS